MHESAKQLRKNLIYLKGRKGGGAEKEQPDLWTEIIETRKGGRKKSKEKEERNDEKRKNKGQRESERGRRQGKKRN